MTDRPAALTAYDLADLDEAQALRFRLIVAASLALGGNDPVAGPDAIAVAEYVRTGAVPVDGEVLEPDGDLAPVPVTVVGPPSPAGPSTWQ